MFIYNESFQDTTITPLLEVSAIKSLAPIGYQSSDNGIAFKVNNDGRSATVINLDATKIMCLQYLIVNLAHIKY